ncbi:branched-chain amino acid ABC transporter permease [Mesorhizobium sp. M2C.T.Ca.TU.009.01.2.1]|nr:branched-chain amino acid ABC transporter permease [Mesorhizobium sp. M2C.T.Ca.TU.009.01.2.1]
MSVAETLTAAKPRSGRAISFLFLAIAIALIVATPFLPNYYVRVINSLLIYILLGIGLNIVIGYAGLLDLGFVAFYAVGAYSYALLASPQLDLHWPFLLILLVAACLGAVTGILLGIPVLRLRGDYLAIVTLGFGEIVKVIFVNGGDFTGGAFGIVAPASSFDTLRPHYWVGLGLMVATALAIRALMRSRYGLALIAVRDDEMAASANGIDTLKVKVAAFAGSAFIAGVAGSLYTFYIFHVGPDSVFDLDWMLLPLMMTVVGGTGTLLGPILGALVMYAVFDLARIVVPDYHPVISGLTIILAMLFLPKGLTRLGAMQRLKST